MSISDVASMVGGAFLGAPVSEILKLVIEEAKKVKDFKPLSQDLASTMERLVPIFKEIDSMQQRCNGELIVLIKTLERAEKMIISTAQRIEFNEHPFWLEKYCACHDIDGTPKCCSCERLEPKETNYVMLGDGRWICLECNESSIMDTYECQPLHYEIREFFKGLNMEIEKQFPLVLVEKQALNTAEEEDKIGHHHEVSTRGCCFSEEVIITSVLRRPKMQSNNMLIEEIETVRTVGKSKIISVMILYGLPRDLEPEVEEGLCQVVAHMWLESQTYASTNGAAASSSASSSSHMRVNTTNEPMFEEKLVEFCKKHIEKDDSPLYGLGFKRVHEMVTNSSLHQTLRGFPSRKLKTERQVQILESNRRTFSNFKGS
ncbi:unnamed protein product [Arabidopsis arenosa]|uniref:RPW8 domain-containing protein n=1 Tax=Arabidopsis arenosa TaxID=38785 RepID=A0A8S1ZI06_ARAAE|nr:unnamed protein product [Arabidopsis arenosa]